MQNDREEPLFSDIDDDDLKTVYEAKAVEEPVKKRALPVLLLAVIILIAVVAVYVFVMDRSEPQPAPAPPPVPEVAPAPVTAPDPTPDIPVVLPELAPVTAEEVEEVEPPPPPLTLAESDPPVRTSLEAAGSPDLYVGLLSNSDLIQRGAGIIDGMSRGLVLNKILPLPRPEGKFKTLELSGQTILDPTGYGRYDPYAQAVSALDMSQLVATFHQFRPLLEQAYAELGYQGEDFDNTLIRSLDQVLATPEIRSEIALKKKEAVYLFADPELEALSPLQKQLMRMGPDNIVLIKAKAKALRAGLLAN